MSVIFIWYPAPWEYTSCIWQISYFKKVETRNSLSHLPLERASSCDLGNIQSIHLEEASGKKQGSCRVCILARVVSLRAVFTEVQCPGHSISGVSCTIHTQQWWWLVLPWSNLQDGCGFVSVYTCICNMIIIICSCYDLHSLPKLNWRILNIAPREIQCLFPASLWSQHFINKSIHYLFYVFLFRDTLFNIYFNP